MALKEKETIVLSTVASRVQQVVLARVDRNTVDRIMAVETVIVTDAPSTDLDQKVAAVVPKVAHKVDVHRVDLATADLAAIRAIARDCRVAKVGLKETVDRAARKARVAPSVVKRP